ncbi:MAG TPA: ankyrin repeat domain-containing protein [Bryobacteraceae bacterium]|nr:ankyrin repeat domain-containing protein [Bryobacteraceae bacterium]
MSRELPAKPNLEHLKNQAKALLHSFQQGYAEAIQRFVAVSASSAPKLADALHTVAREYGFSTWPKLKEHVESLSRVWTPPELLTAAIRASDAARTARVLKEHPELKAHLDEPLANYGAGMNALLAAVQRTDRETIDVLLEAGASIHARSHLWSGGISVLDECAPDLAQFLIERGATLEAHSAARLGMLPELQAIVTENPAAVNARGAQGQTPLHFASTQEIAQFLLEHGAEIDARDLQHESTPSQHMLRVLQARHYRHDRMEIARFLMARGCQTDILMAAAVGDLALVQRHLEANPANIRMSVSEEDFPKHDPRSEGTIYIGIFGPRRTAHLIARDFGHDDVFRLLMDLTPEDLKLALACELGDEDAFRAMLATHPGLIESLSEQDRRRLPDAAQNNNTNAVRLMLAAGWPVDTLGEYHMTPLQWASWHGNAEMVREILKYRPELERMDNEHHISALGSALHGSENSWHREDGDHAATVAALLDAGAKAPRVTDDLEASEPVRELLLQRETTV